MIKIRNLTVKNFMSVGNATQAVDFDRDAYRDRNIVERLIGWLKPYFHRISRRFCV